MEGPAEAGPSILTLSATGTRYGHNVLLLYESRIAARLFAVL